MCNVIYKKCEMCDNMMELKTVTRKNSKNYGKLLKKYKNKRFCSVECQIVWQKTTKWEIRVGCDVANRIRNETSERVSGDKNPSKNQDVASKISKSIKKYLLNNPRIKEKNGMYGKKHTEEYKKHAKLSRIGKRSYNEDGYKKLIQNTPKGENHPNWNSGSSYLPYSFDFNKQLKIIIKQRDKYTCGICNKTTQKLAIHHINYNKDDSDVKNLISLCYKCHPVTNFNREYWILFFKNKIEIIYKQLNE